jgi:predicted RNase H-like nuclease
VWHVPHAPAVIGVDGCPGGWIGAQVDADGRVRWQVLPLDLDVGQLAKQSDAVAVDIPIGLPTSGYRRADVAAKQRLGYSAASSVFFTPVRAVLRANTYTDACTIARRETGKAMSKQTWAIVPRIRAVDEAMTAGLQDRVVEAHPEVSFRVMSAAVMDGKKTGRGVGQRLAALRNLVDVAAALEDAPARIPLDDLLDALACAWTARRWSSGRAESLPDGAEEYDARGLRMRIVA